MLGYAKAALDLLGVAPGWPRISLPTVHAQTSLRSRTSSPKPVSAKSLWVGFRWRLLARYVMSDRPLYSIKLHRQHQQSIAG